MHSPGKNSKAIHAKWNEIKPNKNIEAAFFTWNTGELSYHIKYPYDV